MNQAEDRNHKPLACSSVTSTTGVPLPTTSANKSATAVSSTKRSPSRSLSVTRSGIRTRSPGEPTKHCGGQPRTAIFARVYARQNDSLREPFRRTFKKPRWLAAVAALLTRRFARMHFGSPSRDWGHTVRLSTCIPPGRIDPVRTRDRRCESRNLAEPQWRGTAHELVLISVSFASRNPAHRPTTSTIVLQDVTAKVESLEPVRRRRLDRNYVNRSVCAFALDAGHESHAR